MGVPRGSTAEIRSPKRGIAVVVGVVFVDLLGFGVVIPILPYYVRSFAVSDAVIGLLAASYSLMQFLAAPTLGRLSDERGRRPVILLSLAGSAVAWTVFGVAGEIGAAAGTIAGLGTLFASRMLAGAMGGNIAAANAYVADVTPQERRAGALGLLGASFSLGFIFGPAMGGIAASDAVVDAADAVLPAFVPTTQYSLPSFLAAGLSLLALVLAVRYLEEPDRRKGAGEPRGDRPAGGDVPRRRGDDVRRRRPDAIGGHGLPRRHLRGDRRGGDHRLVADARRRPCLRGDRPEPGR